MITQNRILELFEYRDGGLFWKVKPAKQIAVGSKAGCKNSHGYCVVRADGVLYGAHRIIFLMHHGYLPDYIDHADGNRLNNSIDNLREATASENCYNKSAQSNNTSGEKDAVDADGNPVYQQMDASALVPVMWAELQSLRKRLAALEAK